MKYFEHPNDGMIKTRTNQCNPSRLTLQMSIKLQKIKDMKDRTG